MQTNNKIKARAEDIDVESAQFQQFVMALKQQRPTKTNRVQPLEHNHSVASHPINAEQESSPISKELYSEGSRSLYLQSNRTTDNVSVSFGGDQTLRNKGRVGVANRYAVKQFQLPPQYFNPAKLKLQQFLKDSRMLSNAEGADNAKTGRGGRSHNEIDSLRESKLVRGENKGLKIHELDAEIVLKYCIAYELSQQSDTRQIMQFFLKLLEILNFAIPSPQIQKYKDCIYYGKGTQRRQTGQGFLYFYSGSIYFGELLQNYMHGKGIQINFRMGAIYRGEFREGALSGCFTVTKNSQKYEGMIQNGLYHGYGKLQNKQGTIQGQFREGRLVDKNGNLSKQSIQKNQSHFRIRGSSQQKSHYQQSQAYNYHKNKSFNDQYYQQQPDIDPWSFPQRTPRVKKSRAYSNFNEMIEFSYPFGNQLPAQEPKKSKILKNRNDLFPNPQANIIRNRLSLPKQNLRQMSYINRVRPIREETDFGQEQPLQLKC